VAVIVVPVILTLLLLVSLALPIDRPNAFACTNASLVTVDAEVAPPTAMDVRGAGLPGLHGLVVRDMSRLGIILCLLPVVFFVALLGLAIWDQEHSLYLPCWVDLDCSE
jgi:hypothetical protein